MHILTWQQLEDYIASTLNMKKTVGSGSVFGDCDLYGIIGNFNIRIEVKYRRNLRYGYKEIVKALHQTKPNEILLFIIYSRGEMIVIIEEDHFNKLNINGGNYKKIKDLSIVIIPFSDFLREINHLKGE